MTLRESEFPWRVGRHVGWATHDTDAVVRDAAHVSGVPVRYVSRCLRRAAIALSDEAWTLLTERTHAECVTWAVATVRLAWAQETEHRRVAYTLGMDVQQVQDALAQFGTTTAQAAQALAAAFTGMPQPAHLNCRCVAVTPAQD